LKKFKRYSFFSLPKLPITIISTVILDFLSLHCLRHILNSKNKYFTINHALESPAGWQPPFAAPAVFPVTCSPVSEAATHDIARK